MIYLSCDMFSVPKLLNKFFGWQVSKQARQQLPLAQCLDLEYSSSSAKGIIVLNEKKYACTLHKHSETIIEGTCTCPFYKRESSLCVHIALLFLASSGETLGGQPSSKQKELPFPSESTTILTKKIPAYCITLPDNLLTLSNKNSLPLACECLSNELPHPCDQQFAHWLTQQGGNPLAPPPVLIITQGEALQELWRALIGHPRLLWKKQAFSLQEELPSLPIHLDLIKSSGEDVCKLSPLYGYALTPWGDSLLQTTNPPALIVGLRPPAPLSPEKWLTLLQGDSILLSLDELVKHRESILSQFDIPEKEQYPFLRIEQASPQFSFEWSGTAQKIILHSFVEYPNYKASFPLIPAQVNLLSYQKSTSQHTNILSSAPYWQRHAAEEARLIRQLEQWGFSFTPQGWILEKQDSIEQFWLTKRPFLHHDRQLKEKISPTLLHWTKTLVPLRPQFALISPEKEPKHHTTHNHTALSNDWLEASFSFSASEHIDISTQEIISLLQSGKTHIPLRNGKSGIIDKDLAEDWLALLSESEAKQLSPNHFSLSPRSLSPFLSLQQNYSSTPLSVLSSQEKQQGADALKHIENRCLLTLRPYQLEGIHWMWQRLTQAHGALLGDDMGLGKTLQTLALYLTLCQTNPELQKRPALIVCPASLLYNWQEEAQKAFPELLVDILHGAGREETPIRQLGITTYALLHRDFARHRQAQYGFLAFDEASFVRNPDTDAADALRRIPAEYKLALTGTPIENSIRDLWSIFQITLPHYLGTRAQFKERYESPLTNDSPPQQTLRRLRQKVSPWILRRTKADVAPELPPKTTSIHWCELSAHDKSLYQQIVREGNAQCEKIREKQGKDAARMIMLTTLLRLRQLCDDNRLLHLENKNKLPASEKMLSLMMLLNDLVSNNHKILVFSQFTSMLRCVQEEIQKQSLRSLLLDGSSTNRPQLITQFNQAHGPEIFLISLKAGGYGLNLQTADTVIHLDPWWNPAVEAQATDRAYRIGQQRPVHVYKMITRRSVEEKILALQQRKSKLLSATFNEDPLLDTAGLSDNDLAELTSFL